MTIKNRTELYNFFVNNTSIDFLQWVNENWSGKDKQESAFRLFACLGLIDKLENYDVCVGNFNLKTIKKQKTLNEFFYNDKKQPIPLKDKGDASDMTFISKQDDKNLLATTSKRTKKNRIGKLDLEKILTNFKKYEEEFHTLSFCIVVPDRKELERMKNRSEKTNIDLKNILNRNDTIVIDWADLKQAHHKFINTFGNTPMKDLLDIDSNKPTLLFKLHQRVGILKTIRMKEEGVLKILWGHIQRSGKSYIMAGSIIEDSKDKKKCNYLIITTAPNETIEQYLKVLDCTQLRDFNVVYLHGKNKKPKLEDKNIIICSKQFLQIKVEKGHDKQKQVEEKTENIRWLRNIVFDMRFLDESHNGGTTLLTQKTLDTYGGNAFTVQITATYIKPANNYNIPRSNWILWDLEDIKLCKSINDPNSMERLVEKHGEEFRKILLEYPLDNIIEEYSKYPQIEILSHKIRPENVQEIVQQTENNQYGWSTEACFLLKQGLDSKKNKVILPEFQNEKEVLKLWYTIFGKRKKYDIPDNDYPDDVVFMKRIEKICKNATTKSRFIGDTDEPMIIMAYLPSDNIDVLSGATKKLLEKYNIIPDGEIAIINSKQTSNPKKEIEDARVKAKNGNKKIVLVLSGRQCSMGVSIMNCDIVLLLNNTMSFDMIYQMMFRSMTEEPNKKYGFVVDLNIHRVINVSLVDYASLLFPTKHPKISIKYLLQERLITLNSDHWLQTFGNHAGEIDRIVDTIYDIYSSQMSSSLENIFKRMTLKHDLFSKNEYDLMKTLFNNFHITKENKKLKEAIARLTQQEKIKKGIEKTTIVGESQDEKREEPPNDEEKEINVDPVEILRPISILISLLTIHDKDRSTLQEMYSLIEDNDNKKKILLDQIKIWWGEDVKKEQIDMLMRIFKRYLENDIETTHLIIQVKELFNKNIKNSKELSKIIDKYLIPQENEKKSNAEVSTPHQLRQEMLDKIPLEFWTKERRVFEPCCGKGGFLIDIIDRFMTGLKTKYPDKKQRYKKIVEKCLYFSDINNMNIFICKLLIDPFDDYKLNYNEGDTLKLDIKKQWNLDEFDAVIGNPPYNASGNTGTGNTIWQLFVKKALEEWVLKGKGCYVVYVHPSGWRKPNSEKGKFTGLYKEMVSKNYMRYLSIHGVKEGMKTFQCGTRYDWYIIERIKCNGQKTKIRDEKGRNVEEILEKEWEWFPNHSHLEVKKLLARKGEQKCPVIQSMSAYEPRKSWMSKIKDPKYKYPCVHSTPKSGVRYMYSSVNDRGMFGIPKIIFGDSGQELVVKDFDGKYGMTQHAIGIQVDSINELNKLANFIKSSKFKEIVEMCSWSSYALDWNIFKYFKKDFYKYI